MSAIEGAKLFPFLALLASCTQGTEPLASIQTKHGFADARAAVSVTAADPSFGYQGDVGRRVIITGSGFAAGAVAAWERNGVTDPKVTVLSTVVLSSTQIEATISIAPDAELAFYDISVTSSKGKGVGTEMFEVTTAIPIGSLGGDTEARAASESSENATIVGYSYTASGVQHAFAWSQASRTMHDLGPGIAYAVDAAGVTVAGTHGPHAAVWSLVSGTWQMSLLPRLDGAPESRVRSIASDGAGNATLIGGMESVVIASKTKGRVTTVNHRRPVLWRRANGGWIRTPIASPCATTDGFDSAVHAVNARGQAVGGLQGCGPDRSVFWDSLGRPTVLPGEGTPARGIDGAGTIIVGSRADSRGMRPIAAVYWKAQISADGSRTWSGPFDLPGTCEDAYGIDDLGRIVGSRCREVSSSAEHYLGGVWTPPYDSVTVLRGLGGQNGAWVFGVSRRGTLIVGSSNGRGAFWEYVLSPTF